MASRDVRCVIVTAAGPHMQAVLRDHAVPTFERFAARWGHAVRAEELEHDGRGASETAQQATWKKLALLREALAAYPSALWLDADVLVVRFDEYAAALP